MRYLFLFLLLLLQFQIAYTQRRSPRPVETKAERYKRVEKIRKERFLKERREEIRRDSILDENWNNAGKNILTVSPIAILTDVLKYPHFYPGIQFSIERRVHRNLSVFVPFFIPFKTDYKNIGLGLKIYPNTLKIIHFAGVPTILFGTDKLEDYYYDDYGFTKYQKGRRYSIGIQFHTSFNFFIDKHLYIGILTGPGFASERNKFKHKTLSSIYLSDEVIENSINFYFGLQIGYAF